MPAAEGDTGADSSGRLKGDCLITHRAPLSEAMEMYRLFEQKEDGVMKVALTPVRGRRRKKAGAAGFPLNVLFSYVWP